jgi:hypothetical protein
MVFAFSSSFSGEIGDSMNTGTTGSIEETVFNKLDTNILNSHEPEIEIPNENWFDNYYITNHPIKYNNPRLFMSRNITENIYGIDD